MSIKDDYLIKKNKDDTFIISKANSDDIYRFVDISKIIVDNLENGKDYTINKVLKEYDISKEEIEKDYDIFIKELEEMSNKNIKIIDISKGELNTKLGSDTLKSCTIEITNLCPFKCDHCYVKKTKHIMMEFEMFKRIIDNLERLNCYNILLTGGDPLVHPDFIKMYSYAKNKGFIISLNTSAFIINNKILNLLSSYKPHNVEISIYGYDNKSYENFTHTKESFNMVDNNIHKLLDNNIKVSLKTTLTKKNYLFLDKIKEYSKKLKLQFRYDYIVFPKLENNRFGKNKEALLPDQIVKVISQDKEDINYFETAVKETIMLKNQKNEIRNIFQCSIGKEQVFIDCNGYIKPCLVLNEKYSINDYSIEDVLNITLNGICKLEFSGNSKCKNCHKRKLCRYCPGRFYLTTGSYEIPPKEYCELSDLIMNKFSKDFYFELYDYDNKIPENKYNKIYDILVENENIITKKDNSSKEMYNKWVNMILNTKDYNILLCYKDDIIVGFIAFMYLDMGLMLSEIQIKREYQGKYNILKRMLKELLHVSDKNRYDALYGTINSNNIKSRKVFTHIGFKNQEGILYKIEYEDLLKWIKK